MLQHQDMQDRMHTMLFILEVMLTPARIMMILHPGIYRIFDHNAPPRSVASLRSNCRRSGT